MRLSRNAGSTRTGRGRRTDPRSNNSLENHHETTHFARCENARSSSTISLGQASWGTILALEYMLTDPTGVKSVIMSSPAISIPRWLADADSLVATLADSLQAAIESNEAAGTYDSPEYQEAVMAFYGLYLARKHPWSADLDSAFAQFNLELYGYMWGPSEFTATGTLKDYDGSDRLSELSVPVLFTTGRYDEATPATVAYYQSKVPGAELAILEEART